MKRRLMTGGISALLLCGMMLTGCGSGIPANKVHSVADLNGKTIGVQEGTTGNTLAGDIENATVETYAKAADGIMALEQGKIDAVIVDSETANAFVATHPDITVLDEAFAEEDIDGLGTYIEPAAPRNIYEEFWGKLSLQIMMSYGHEPYYVTEKTLNSAFITASCAYRKKLLVKIRGFSNYFANNAEDIDLCWRALDAGAKLKYVPEAKILARSPRDLKGIRKKSFRNGVSSSKLQKVYSKSKINFDGRLYKALFSNIAGVFRGEKYAKLFVYEIVHHLAGKQFRPGPVLRK